MKWAAGDYAVVCHSSFHPHSLVHTPHTMPAVSLLDEYHDDCIKWYGAWASSQDNSFEMVQYETIEMLYAAAWHERGTLPLFHFAQYLAFENNE